MSDSNKSEHQSEVTFIFGDHIMFSIVSTELLAQEGEDEPVSNEGLPVREGKPNIPSCHCIELTPAEMHEVLPSHRDSLYDQSATIT